MRYHLKVYKCEKSQNTDLYGTFNFYIKPLQETLLMFIFTICFKYYTKFKKNSVLRF